MVRRINVYNVKCPDCGHKFETQKEETQCGNFLRGGRVCGARFNSKENEV